MKNAAPDTVIPFRRGGNFHSRPLHAPPLELRMHHGALVVKLTRYLRTTKNMTASSLRAMLKGCGVIPTGKGVSLVRHTINGESIGGSVRGVRACHDRLCPLCAARIEAAEALETRAALLHLHYAGKLEGLRLIFFTATMGHRADDDHAGNWSVFRTVLSKLTDQRWWRAAIAGSIMKLEIEGTLDPAKTGLHPHAHMLLAIPETVDSLALSARVHEFFRSEFAKHYPNETRIRWHWNPSETWWQIAEGSECLPRFLAMKRWTICEEVTASGAKNGGFWQRPVEDLVAVWELMKGVRTLRRSGIFREVAAVIGTARTKPVVVPIAKMTRAEWSALAPEIREPLTAAVENHHAEPAWIAWTVANLGNLTPAEAEMLLIHIATADGSDALPAVPSAAAAREVVLSGRAVRAA